MLREARVAAKGEGLDAAIWRDLAEALHEAAAELADR
jgi:hypothetical protein